MNRADDNATVGKEDRKRRVLDVLIETSMALPSVVIFRNVKLQGATFERRSVNNYLRELVEEGYVRKVSPEALDRGELVDVETSEQGYYLATDRASEFPG